MANTKSAEKRIRQTLVARARNRSDRSTLRTAIKGVRSAVEDGNAETAQGLLASTLKTLDTSAQKGIIHKNAAARKKSRLVRAVANIEA